MQTYNNEQHETLIELIFMHNGSSLGLSYDQKIAMISMYDCLSAYERKELKESLKLLDVKLPTLLKNHDIIRGNAYAN